MANCLSKGELNRQPNDHSGISRRAHIPSSDQSLHVIERQEGVLVNALAAQPTFSESQHKSLFQLATRNQSLMISMPFILEGRSAAFD